jgi:DNA-binding beta-propeller fold protein YncE
LRVDAKTGVLTIVCSAKPKDAAPGDNGPVREASFNAPHNLVADADGNLFIADTYHYSVRRVDAATGIVTTVAGTGTKGFSGDGGPAVAAELDGIACLCFSHDFTKLYLGGFSRVIRVVDMATGTISTVSGIGGSRAMAVDSKGNIFTPARTGLRMCSPEGRAVSLEDPGATPPLNAPKHLWVDGEDNILIADAGNHLIRKFIVAERRLETLAGVGARGVSGVPGPALQAELGEPHGVVAHPRTGDIYIADSRNHRVLRLRTVAPLGR